MQIEHNILLQISDDKLSGFGPNSSTQGTLQEHTPTHTTTPSYTEVKLHTFYSNIDLWIFVFNSVRLLEITINRL